MENKTIKNNFNSKLASDISADSVLAKTKKRSSWFNKDEVQNVSAVGAMIRAVLVIFIPIISVCLDWFLDLHTMYFLAPLIVYCAVTAMTRNSPIIVLFSRLTKVH